MADSKKEAFYEAVGTEDVTFVDNHIIARVWYNKMGNAEEEVDLEALRELGFKTLRLRKMKHGDAHGVHLFFRRDELTGK